MLPEQYLSWVLDQTKSFLMIVGIPIFKAIGVVIIGILISKFVQRFAKKMASRAKISDELIPILCTSAKYGVYIITAGIALSILSSDLSSYTSMWFTSAGFTIVKAIAIAIIGVIAVSYGEKIVRKALVASKLDTILHSFVSSTFKIAAYIIIAISTADALGVPTTSFIAAISAVGLALSLAVKDNISNLVGGIVIIVTKPFVNGDFIEMDGVGGRVAEIGLVYTILYTYDNKKVFIPNNDAARAKITNHSAESTRRLDLVFTIGYNDSIIEAKEIVLNVAKKSGLMDATRDPVIGVSAQGAHGIDIATKLWVDWPDYYALQFYMLENVKYAFDAHHISIPYNQVDVHIINPAALPKQ